MRCDAVPPQPRATLLKHRGQFGALSVARQPFDLPASLARQHEPSPPKDASGHRARLCVWLVSGDGKGVSGNELVEYLLVFAMRRGVTKATIKALLRDETFSVWTTDRAAVHTRAIVKGALAPGSSNLILVHNQPTRVLQPSHADIQLTRDIVEAGKRLGIVVHDHVIIGARGHACLRALSEPLPEPTAPARLRRLKDSSSDFSSFSTTKRRVRSIPMRQ